MAVYWSWKSKGSPKGVHFLKPSIKEYRAALTHGQPLFLIGLL
jgi:hypothetical protein